MSRRSTAMLLAFFLGGLGVHKFFLNKPGQGIIYALCGTVGWMLVLPAVLIGILCIVDILRYASMSDTAFDAKYPVQA